jgi:hypothetical protein
VTSLHPALDALYTDFNRMCDEVASGHLDFQEAVGLLNNMVVHDSTGAEWRVNTDGQFVRGFPGQPGQPADPATFQPADSGLPRTAAPAFADTPAFSTSPAFPSSPVFPADGSGQVPFEFPAAPSQPGPDFDEQFGLPGESQAAAGRSSGAKKKRVKAPKAPKASRSGRTPVSRVGDAIADVNWGGLLHGRGRTALIAVVCGAVLFVGYQVTSKPASTNGSIPNVSATTSQVPQMPADETSAAPAPAGSDTAAVSVPTGDDLTKLLNTVASGDRGKAAAVVAGAGDEVQVALAAATLTGYVETGLEMVPGTAAADGAGAVVDVRLVNAADDKTYAVAKARLVVQDKVWKFATWPDFVRQ